MNKFAVIAAASAFALISAAHAADAPQRQPAADPACPMMSESAGMHHDCMQMSADNAGHGAMMNQPSMGDVHSATGKVVDVKRKPVAISQRAPAIMQVISVTIAHDPVQSLNWPAMTMDFGVESHELASKVKKGDAVRFEFTKRDGDYVITDLHKARGSPAK